MMPLRLALLAMDLELVPLPSLACAPAWPLQARSPTKPCWSSRPSLFLFLALVALTLVSVTLASVGPGSIAAIPVGHCFLALAWVAAWSVAVNDPLKVVVARALAAAHHE